VKVQQVRTKGAGSCLAMRSCNGNSPVLVSDQSKHFGTLDNQDIFFGKMTVLRMINRNCRGINHQVGIFGDQSCVFFKMNQHTFLLQRSSKRGGSAVISADFFPE